MKNYDYYLKEILGLFGKKTALAVLSTMFLLLLSMALTIAFFVGGELGDRLASEANIAVFYDSDIKLDQLIHSIKNVEGVLSVEKVSKEEALEEMKAHLGEELTIIERLGENPFDPYLRVAVSTEIEDVQLDKISRMPFVSHVRDNREALFKIRGMTRALAQAGLVVVIISFSTMALISYYVSAENIHTKEEMIAILKTLRAPYSFIIRPFLWYSILVNLISGLFAFMFLRIAVSFIPFETNVRYSLIGIIFWALSVLVGVIATLVSGKSVSKNYKF